MQFGMNLIRLGLISLGLAALPLVLVQAVAPAGADPFGPWLVFVAGVLLAFLMAPSGALIAAIAWWRGEHF